MSVHVRVTLSFPNLTPSPSHAFPEHRIPSHPCDAYIRGKCVAKPPLVPASVREIGELHGISGSLVGVQRPFWMAHFIWLSSIFGCCLFFLANGEWYFRFFL
ncbi:hypothetical protein JTE90_000523 [Oedothorax gibbosus]|uniref:Uncharacterized protein n=1 Tax=Oedothorax gibbosus TaxID=931172 RepID=A0AAV6VV60_9ARAC|nr:hypothetical protein JTE90_000523 [Oedothorax gibbosus]